MLLLMVITLILILSLVSGIPQGSVLGPLLFTLKMYQISSTQLCIFAKDTKLHKTITSYDNHNILQDLDKWTTRSTDWLLKQHSDKCKVLSITRHDHVLFN